MIKVSESKQRSNAKERVGLYWKLVRSDFEFSTRLLLIQQLIPLGLMAVEVTHLVIGGNLERVKSYKHLAQLRETMLALSQNKKKAA